MNTKFLTLLSLILISCKSYKENILENTCGSKKIDFVMEKPFKTKENNSFYSLSFLSGFQNDTVRVIANDSIYLERIMQTEASMSYADNFLFKDYIKGVIEIKIGDEGFCFSLNKNYSYYEIHNSERVYYLKMRHIPSILE